MAKKSVRQMTDAELRRNSLSAKVYRATLMGSLVLSFVMLVIGLPLYIYSMTEFSISESYDTAVSAASVIRKTDSAARLTSEVMDIYRNLSDEERLENGTQEYRDKFAHLTETDEYNELIDTLEPFARPSNVSDVYIGVYDRDTDALVYICDPDEDSGITFMPGDFEEVDERELETFLDSGDENLSDMSDTERYGWICTSGIPVNREDPDTTYFVLADVTLGNIIKNISRILLIYTAILLFTVQLVGYLINIHIKKTLTAPINSIAGAARSYADDRQAGKTTADHFSKLNIRSGDEVENLSLVMADMENSITEYEENLKIVTAEKEHIKTELELARRIQANMLPDTFPPYPDRHEFDLYAHMDPAREVGGDFYDFFFIDDDHLCLMIADVAGKGIPAALFMMASKIIIADNAVPGRSPSEILETVNNIIYTNNREEMFVTVWLGILEVSTGILRTANAGHEYPAFMKAGGEFELVKDKHGFVLGAMENMKFPEHEMQMEAGSRIFVYTDGVTEASDEEENLFGTDRMIEALNRAEGDDPESIIRHMYDAAAEFEGKAEQFDDMTMLCLKYNGPTE